jgi:hypothetical protein
VDILPQLFRVFNVFLRSETDFRGLSGIGGEFRAGYVKNAKSRRFRKGKRQQF